MLYDAEFLKKLDEGRTKTIYARIIALSHDETPIETIEGRITQGSVNIDGASAVRRTCSLTMVASGYDYNNYLWGLNTKFKLEVGVENLVDPTYPKIIWFKQGTYFISSFNTAQSTSSFTITIQGKDKMCGLNGEIGGALTSSVDFGTIEEIDNTTNTRRLIKLPVKDIIKNIVSTYGGEPAHNIIINDLDMIGLELLEYRYDENTPLYLYRDVAEHSVFSNVILDGTKKCQIVDSITATTPTVKYCNPKTGERFAHYPTEEEEAEMEGFLVDVRELTLNDLLPQELELLVNPFTGSSKSPSIIRFEDEIQDEEDPDTFYDAHAYVAKISYGDTAGYRFTDLTYPGDLIGNVGESLTSILDKIKGILGDYEYFYNLDGMFVFQKKKTYVNSTWSPIAQDSEGTTYINDSSPVVYTFKNGELVTAFNNNPNLSNVRNDFSVWGQRTSLSGAAIPVHMRYAIDQKPTKYNSIQVLNTEQELIDYNNKYDTSVSGQDTWTYIFSRSQSIDEENRIVYCDWREIIYQMAKDYYKYAHILNDFEYRLIQVNPQYPTGKTGYENYYIDLISFWRDLYDPDLIHGTTYDALVTLISDKQEAVITAENTVANKTKELEAKQVDFETAKDDLTKAEVALGELQLNTNATNEEIKAATNSIKTYQDLLTEAQEAVKAAASELETYKKNLTVAQNELHKAEDKLSRYSNYFDNGDYQYWNKTVYVAPQNLNFWFDFLDSSGELSQYSVKNIGCRPKAVNNSNVKAIYFRETPDVVFSTDLADDTPRSSAYTYIKMPVGLEEIMFTISSQGKSAKTAIDELLYQHGYCTESTTINTVPIYYLEPNARIQVIDEATKLNGYYIISKISMPLTYNGTMSITATRAATLEV